MDSYQAAAELLEDVAGLPLLADVLVTDDPSAAGAQLAAGGLALILGPPEIEWPTYHRVSYTWTAVLVAPQLQHRADAHAALAPIVAGLLQPLDLDAARTAEFSPEGSTAAYAAYVLTFTTEHDI